MSSPKYGKKRTVAVIESIESGLQYQKKSWLRPAFHRLTFSQPNFLRKGKIFFFCNIANRHKCIFFLLQLIITLSFHHMCVVVVRKQIDFTNAYEAYIDNWLFAQGILPNKRIKILTSSFTEL